MELNFNYIYPKKGQKSCNNGAKKHTKASKTHNKYYTNSTQNYTGNFLKKWLVFGRFLIVIFTLKQEKSAK